MKKDNKKGETFEEWKKQWVDDAVNAMLKNDLPPHKRKAMVKEAVRKIAEQNNYKKSEKVKG